MLKKIYDWLGSKVHSKYAGSFLCLLFYLEAIALIPVDPILILYCLENRNRAFTYAAMATVSSILGGISAYFIGSFLWDIAGQQILDFKIIAYVLPQETFFYLRDLYHQYATWAILISGFTPIPYKAATLSAGFCKLPLFWFILFSFISRGARFFLEAGIIRLWGDKIKIFIDRYFNILTIIFVLILVGIFFIAK